MKIRRTLPVKVLLYAAKNTLYNELRVYLWLHFFTNGRVVLDKKLRSRICTCLNIHKDTLRKCLKWLHSNEWIDLLKHERILLKRSIDIIRLEVRSTSRCSVIMYPSQITIKAKFYGFIGAALMTYMIDQKEKKIRRGQMNGSQENKGWRRPLEVDRPPSFYPISTNAMSDYFNISRSKAHRLKKAAVHEGFVLVKNQNVEIEIGSQSPPGFVKEARKRFPEVGIRLFFTSGKVYEKRPNLYCSNLTVKPRRLDNKKSILYYKRKRS